MGSVQRCPIPRQQLIQPVDLVVVDAVENVSKIHTKRMLELL